MGGAEARRHSVTVAAGVPAGPFSLKSHLRTRTVLHKIPVGFCFAYLPIIHGVERRSETIGFAPGSCLLPDRVSEMTTPIKLLFFVYCAYAFSLSSFMNDPNQE